MDAALILTTTEDIFSIRVVFAELAREVERYLLAVQNVRVARAFLTNPHGDLRRALADISRR